MKNILFMALILTLAGCGGGQRFKNKGGSSYARSVPASAPMASGPISRACMASDRKARSPRLCGCIQGVADQTLNSAQQRRAVAFYSNPQLAQDIRQSDRSSNEQFWKAYKEYGERAQQLCS